MRTWRSEIAGSLGISAVSGDRFVIVNAGGEPVRPEAYSDEWVRLCHAAGIKRRVLLHEARHSSITTMRANDVPGRIVAAWHGHDESVTTWQWSSQVENALTCGNNEADPARRRIGFIVLLSQTTRAREDSNL